MIPARVMPEVWGFLKHYQGIIEFTSVNLSNGAVKQHNHHKYAISMPLDEWLINSSIKDGDFNSIDKQR